MNERNWSKNANLRGDYVLIVFDFEIKKKQQKKTNKINLDFRDHTWSPSDSAKAKRLRLLFLRMIMCSRRVHVKIYTCILGVYMLAAFRSRCCSIGDVLLEKCAEFCIFFL